jgi:hypothetical protein
MCKDGETNIHDEQQSGLPSVVTAMLKVLTKKFVKDNASQFQNFYENFHS